MTIIGLFTCCFVVQLFIHIRAIMSSLILKSSQLIEEEILVKKRNLSLKIDWVVILKIKESFPPFSRALSTILCRQKKGLKYLIIYITIEFAHNLHSCATTLSPSSKQGISEVNTSSAFTYECIGEEQSQFESSGVGDAFLVKKLANKVSFILCFYVSPD